MRRWLAERRRRLRLMAKVAGEVWVYGKPLIPPSRLLVTRWTDSLIEGPDGERHAIQRIRVALEVQAPIRVSYVGIWPGGPPQPRQCEPGDSYLLHINRDP